MSLSDPMNVPVQPYVKAIVQRHITEEETVSFEGLYVSDVVAREAVTEQLALCRAHMIRFNEEVRLVDQKKAAELAAEIEVKGEAVRKLNTELTALRDEIVKTRKRGGMALAEPATGVA